MGKRAHRKPAYDNKAPRRDIIRKAAARKRSRLCSEVKVYKSLDDWKHDKVDRKEPRKTYGKAMRETGKRRAGE